MLIWYNRLMKRRVNRTINAASAAEMLGEIRRGCSVFALSKGQCSLVDVVQYLLDAVDEPADVVVATWTAAGADLSHVRGLLTDGRLRTCRWIVDASFKSRQPAFFDRLVNMFGAGSVKQTKSHAEFVMISTASGWRLVLRTSANLNLNGRIESFEVSDDPALFGYMADFVESVWEVGADPGASSSDAEKTYQDILGAPDVLLPLVDFHTNERVSFD